MSLTISGLVYLFSDMFVEGARLLGEEVPCKDIKVKQNKLAVMLVTAALTWLYKNGHVEVSMGKRSKLLGLRKLDTIALRKGSKPSLPSKSLEMIFWNKLKNDDDLFEATSRLIGRKTKVPVAIIINIVKDYLVDEGYFNKKKRMMILTKYVPECERIKETEKNVDEAKELLSSIEGEELRIYNQIQKDVEAGINNMTEVDDE